MADSTTTKSNMPVKPYVGLTFRPYSTDAIGVVTTVIPSKRGAEVTYRFEHGGSAVDAPRYTRPYSELRKLAYKL